MRIMVEPQITGMDRQEIVREVMSNVLQEIGLKQVLLHGEMHTPYEAFVNHDGLDSLSGYGESMHREMFGTDMPETVAFSVGIMLMTDALLHAQEHFLTPDGVLSLDALSAQYGTKPVPTFVGMVN
jgi:hypothetical protein